jgi:predicted  nucleic acid-binding Zn-ribbon protein
VQADVQSLLAVQAEDAEIRALEKRLAKIEPRLADLDRVRQVAADALDRARGAVEREEQRQRELQHKVTEHRTLHERNVAQLDGVRKLRDATAAMSQVEQARRILADEEGELQGVGRHLGELRETVETQQQALDGLAEEQRAAREAAEAERVQIWTELAGVRARRDEKALQIAKPLLTKYDRIRIRRKSDALFPLRGPSCGNCDTAIPLQRRHQMVASGAIEMCEACGVLLYATN